MSRMRLLGGWLFAVALMFVATNASAYHPSYRYNNLVRIAHELENAATRAHEGAEDQAHHGNSREEYALATLHRLNEAAAHFHNEVETNFRNPRHTEADFRVLVNSYFAARSAMRGLHAFDYVYFDVNRVGLLMNQLVQVYSPYGNHFPHRGGYGYYDGRNAYRHDYGWQSDDEYYNDDSDDYYDYNRDDEDDDDHDEDHEHR